MVGQESAPWRKHHDPVGQAEEKSGRIVRGKGEQDRWCPCSARTLMNQLFDLG